MPIRTKAKFNLRKGTVRQVNLRKLSPRAADFARHVNAALQGTSYMISSVTDYSGKPFKNEYISGDRETYVSVSLRRTIQTPGGVRESDKTGRILVSRANGPFQIEMNIFSSDYHVRSDMQTVESRVETFKF